MTDLKPPLAIAICLACAWGAWNASRADMVQTARARLEGKTILREGAILVGDTAVALNEVLIAIRDMETHTVGLPETVRLTNGETWRGRILGLESNMVAVRSDMFGEHGIGAESVASLDFSHRFDPAAVNRRGFLYREKGEPIPGRIIWIREDMLAIDCPLGVLTVPREGTIRYLFNEQAVSFPSGGEAEIGLIDGSIFRGRMGLASNGLEIAHPALGAMSFPWAAVRYIMRSPPGVKWLGLPEAGDVEVRRPAGPSPAPVLLDYRNSVEPRQSAQSCLTAMRMRPTAVVRYRVPPHEGNKAEFRAVAAIVPGGRGSVRVGLRVSGVRIYEGTLDPTGVPAELSVKLPPGDELVIEADFAGPLLFPCGVDWRDPHIMIRKPGDSE